MEGTVRFRSYDRHFVFHLSGRRESDPGSLAPHASAIPLRYAPLCFMLFLFPWRRKNTGMVFGTVPQRSIRQLPYEEKDSPIVRLHGSFESVLALPACGRKEYASPLVKNAKFLLDNRQNDGRGNTVHSKLGGQKFIWLNTGKNTRRTCFYE